MYYHQREGTREKIKFMDFCQEFWPDHPVKPISSGKIKNEPLIFVMLVPNVGRFCPDEHFSAELQTFIRKHDLNGNQLR